jgi:hypothetical protein
MRSCSLLLASLVVFVASLGVAGCTGHEPTSVAPPNPPPLPSAPVIALSDTSIAFTAVAGRRDTMSQTIAITNGGAGTLSGLRVRFSFGGDRPVYWLVYQLSSAHAPATLRLMPRTGTLPPGSWTDTLTVSSDSTGVAPRKIAVSFTVTQASSPTIAVSEFEHVFFVNAGDANPARVDLQVVNAGPGVLSGLTIKVRQTLSSTPPGWISATLSQATAPATLSLNVSTAGVQPGQYIAWIDVSSPVASNGLVTLAVQFVVRVSSGTAIGLSAQNVDFVSTGFDRCVVYVMNAGIGTLGGLSAHLFYQRGEPTNWLSDSLEGSTAPSTLWLKVTRGSLPPGLYHATVTLASTDSAVSARQIPVTFNVVN